MKFRDETVMDITTGRETWRVVKDYEVRRVMRREWNKGLLFGAIAGVVCTSAVHWLPF